jgi:alpha-mannosidase
VLEQAAGRWRVSEDQIGIVSLETVDGREMLAAPIGLVVIDDESDTWGHEVDAFRNVAGRPQVAWTKVIEDGPVVRTVRQRARWRSSLIELDVLTWRHSDALELRLRANWQEPRQILKLEIPTRISGARTFASAPGGVSERASDGGEEPCQDWLALEGTSDGQTFSMGVVNDSTYSYDCLDGLLRLTCLRSTPYAEHRPWKLPEDFAGPYLDQGWQERRFSLVAGKDSYTTLDLARRAEEFQSRPASVMDSAHPGHRPREQSLFEAAPNNISVLACKRSEDGESVIVRLQETQGRETEALVELRAFDSRWTAIVGPWQVRTFSVSLRDQGVREVDLLERDVVVADVVGETRVRGDLSPTLP